MLLKCWLCDTFQAWFLVWALWDPMTNTWMFLFSLIHVEPPLNIKACCIGQALSAVLIECSCPSSNSKSGNLWVSAVSFLRIGLMRRQKEKNKISVMQWNDFHILLRFPISHYRLLREVQNVKTQKALFETIVSLGNKVLYAQKQGK